VRWKITGHQHGLSVLFQDMLTAVSEASSLNDSFIFLLMKDLIFLATYFKLCCKLSTQKTHILHIQMVLETF